MTENYKSNPSETLRASVLSSALSTLAITGRTAPSDALRRLKMSDQEDDFPRFTIHVFAEGSQDDRAIVQVSFATYGVDEAHLVIKDEGMSYEEESSDGAYVVLDEVDDEAAVGILQKIAPILDR